ncbi:hypothetical protein [Capnocytophaga gingivalis]
MTTTTLSPSKPHFLTDKQGNTIYAVLPIDQYHQMLDIVRSYEMGDDLLTEEDNSIEIQHFRSSKQESLE